GADRAYQLPEESDPRAGAGDILSRVLWRSVGARVFADRGRTADAERLSREAVALADDTDSLALQADARLGLTHVLRSLGRSGPAERTLAEAIDLYQRKGTDATIERSKDERLLERLPREC